MNDPAAPSLGALLDAWELFRDPIVTALVAGGVLGLLGVYVVLKRMVFVGAAVTQSAALGVALAFYADIHLGLGLDPIYGAAALSLAATLTLLVEPERLRLTRELLLGFVFVFSGAAAVLVGDRISQEAHDIQSILFGTAVLVRPFDLWAVVVTGGVLTALHLWWHRGLVFASFDPTAARIQGLPVWALQAVVLLSIGLMVGVAAHALGALPVFALSTLPAAAALQVRVRLHGIFGLAALAGAVSGAGGYLMAFFLGFPVGACQACLAAALLVLALVLRGGAGLLVRGHAA